ncbi:MAG TPA: acetyl-CoA hydrolase/transferase C-terminal domain-containing protein [Dehalococcoidia bacterium]
MDWQAQAGDKLMSPEDAVSVVKSGDRVGVAPFTTTPFTLCDALFARRHDLDDLRIDHPAALFAWLNPDEETSHVVTDNYATPLNRDLVNAGLMEYLPVARWRQDELPAGFNPAPDVFLVPLSPPDRHGYCSFGTGVWVSKRLAQNARTVVAEIHENFIRTGGDNFIHISEIDRACVATRPTGNLPIPPRSDEETLVTEVICTLVASELVNDRDTVQIGVGTVSAALGVYLGEKQDLGVQTELITGGIAQLVRDGVVTGKYKTLHREKVVGSACVALPEEDLQLIDGNPAFELYDFGYTDDIRLLVQQPNLVAVNNALLVDLTGQVDSESIGSLVWTGVGGQTAFMIAAQYSPGGRSVIVLPSSHLIEDARRSRIVGALPEGSLVTVPRTLVDYVVTENGIASLRGKNVRERIGELISVAHADFQSELKTEAKRLYGIIV